MLGQSRTGADPPPPPPPPQTSPAPISKKEHVQGALGLDSTTERLTDRASQEALNLDSAAERLRDWPSPCVPSSPAGAEVRGRNAPPQCCPSQWIFPEWINPQGATEWSGVC